MSYALEHKVPRYGFREITNIDPEFYSVVGPFLSRREIVDELGAPVWDDNGKRWILAVAEDARVLGICAERNGEVCSFWVEPKSRGQLVGTALLYRLVNRYGANKATATDAAVQLFIDSGFVEVGKRGRYTILKRDML